MNCGSIFLPFVCERETVIQLLSLGKKKKHHMRSNICQNESCFLTSVPQTGCTLTAVTSLILARFKLSYSKVSVSARRYNYSCHLDSGSYVPFYSCICLLCLLCRVCRCLVFQITGLWTVLKRKVSWKEELTLCAWFHLWMICSCILLLLINIKLRHRHVQLSE